MLDYSPYHAAMIAAAASRNVFIYWVVNTLCALDESNYGRGSAHWIEFLGRYTPEECKQKYPQTPLLSASDLRINAFIRGKIAEMDDLI